MYFNSDSSYLLSLTCNMDVRVHIGRSSGRYTPWYGHVVVKNGTFTLLLLQLIQAGQLADVPSILTCSCQEWQFHIATDIKWSRMAILHCY